MFQHPLGLHSASCYTATVDLERKPDFQKVSLQKKRLANQVGFFCKLFENENNSVRIPDQDWLDHCISRWINTTSPLSRCLEFVSAG
jgi:hypothetical protein